MRKQNVYENMNIGNISVSFENCIIIFHMHVAHFHKKLRFFSRYQNEWTQTNDESLFVPFYWLKNIFMFVYEASQWYINTETTQCIGPDQAHEFPKYFLFRFTSVS